VKHIAPMRVISFCLLAVCGAPCQNARPAADSPPRDTSDVSEVRRPIRIGRSLPDAPLVQPRTRAEKFPKVVDEEPSPFMLAAGGNAAVMRSPEPRSGTGQQTSLTFLYKVPAIQNEPGTFFGKYLSPSLLKQSLHYQSSTSVSVVGRAIYAGSRLFVTRDDFGKRRVNVALLFGILSSVTLHTANRPYWSRSASAPFNDFGSTIGSDAGINLLHEFGPGMRQMLKDHTPKFIGRIEERLSHDPKPWDAQRF
jgi:hypothetical protein